MRKLVYYIPEQAKAWIVKRHLNSPYQADNELLFKVAESREELEQAFELLHGAYVDAKFMLPHPSNMRLSVYQALPSTTTLIAKLGDEVVGTVSILNRDVFQLPLEKIFKIDHLISRCDQIVEVSSLAVKKSYSKDRKSIFLSLCKYLFHYVSEYTSADHLAIAVNPRHAGIYEKCLMFDRISSQKVDSYGFANGAPAVGLYINLKSAPEKFKKVYSIKSCTQNLYEYFFEIPTNSQFIFPESESKRRANPILLAEDLEYFFKIKTKLFYELTSQEILRLRSAYANLPTHLSVLPDIKAA